MQHTRPIERLEESLVHQNPWWLVFYDRVALPSGGEGNHLRLTPATRRPGAVALLVHDRPEGRFVGLVHQWRYAQGGPMWELPRGFGDPVDEDAAATAAREVLEETGIQAAQVTHLGDVTPDSAIIEGSVGVYLVHAADTETVVRPTDGEADALVWARWSHFLEQVCSGEIRDAFTLAALGLLLARESSR
jgi:8-oxo-dGTP pyrophosphatase MutT (NUDIX family)